MTSPDFMELLNNENLLAAETLKSNVQVFNTAIAGWDVSVVPNYFKKLDAVYVLAMTYRIQVDKANFLVISNVLRHHYSAALSQLRIAIDNSVISFGIFHSPDNFIALVKKYDETHDLDLNIKKLAHKIFEEHSEDLNNQVKSLKEMLNHFGPHPSYGHLGSNVTIDSENSSLRVSIFDEQHPELEVGILGCMLHGITFFHEALMLLSKKQRSDLLATDAITNINKVEQDIDKMKRENVHLFAQLFN